MSDWREDPTLVRDETAPEPEPIVDERWLGMFDELLPMVMGGRVPKGLIQQALNLMIHQARRYVAQHPEAARATVLEAMRMVAAQLRIEPAEVFTPAALEPPTGG